MDAVTENPQNDPGMEGNRVESTDEIDKSFEIINKDDLELVKTDELNNKTETAVGTEKTETLTEVDATNNNTIVETKPTTGRSISEQVTSDRKYSRDELLQIKKSAGIYRSQISVDAILRPNNPLLDQALTADLKARAMNRQNSNPKDPITCLMPSFDRPPQGRNYNKRDSYKGRNSNQGPGSKDKSLNFLEFPTNFSIFHKF